MPTPVEVSRIQKDRDRIVRLGGIWRDRPWSMSERNVIREIGLSDRERHWDFFVMLDGKAATVLVRSENGRKHLTVGGERAALLTLPTADLTASGDDLD
jgi:hypothetical protein